MKPGLKKDKKFWCDQIGRVLFNELKLDLTHKQEFDIKTALDYLRRH